jgi:hypothetical protein
MRATDRNRSRKDAEARFPIKIDVPVPAYGEPWPFAEMLEWCNANGAAGAWAQHGFMDKKRRDERGIPIDVTRWYFANEADAKAFRRRWQSSLPSGDVRCRQ